MSSIDERVVQMKFDNAQFESGIRQTQNSLDGLKKGLNLDASAKSLENLNAAGNKFSLAGIANGVQDLASKFGALSIVGITALTNIANRAVDAGLAIARSLTVDPIAAGLQEYETNLNSIQTVLANTQVAGATLDDVNAALQNLNTYSDKTIYNFSEMAKNIGTFTAAGVDLKTSTEAIKGIANLAALSGSNSQQASSAMYQLSQALASGKVQAIDWISVVNSGMGGTTFQRALAETAVAMGKLSASQVTLAGDMKTVTIAGDSFKDSLASTSATKGWLTSDILTNTLKQFTSDLTDADLAAMGFKDDQIAGIQQMAQTAMHAATEVKTLSAVFDTAGETAGSGWAQTWQLIFGDFGEAKTLFTGMSNGLNDLINASSDARNKVVQDWKALGGRTMAIEALKNVFDAVLAVAKTIGHAFQEIFPPITGKQLADMTAKFRDFTKALMPNAENMDRIKRSAKGVFALFDIGFLIIQKVWGVFERLMGTTKGAGSGFLDITAKIGDFLVKLRDTLTNSEKLNKFFLDLGKFLVDAVNHIKDFGNKFVETFNKVLDKLKTVKLDTSGFVAAFDNLRNAMAKLKPSGESISKLWDGLINIFKRGLEIGQQMASKLGEAFKGIGSGIEGATKGINFQTILGIVGTGLLGGILVMIRNFFKTIKGAIEDFQSGGGILNTIKEAFGGLTDTLGQMQSTLKASTLILIAGAIALLTLSVVELSKIDASKLPAVLAAMTVMFVQLSTALAVLDKINILGSAKNMAIIGGAMILLAIAIKILASAVGDIAKLDWQGVLKGLTGVTGLLIGLSAAAKIMSGQNGNMIATGLAMIAVAIGIKILASACEDFSKLSWDSIAKGLTGVGTVLGALAIFTRISQVNKGSMIQAGGFILLAVALKLMASAINDFGSIDPKKMEQGLGTLTAVLGILAVFTRVVNPGGMIGTAIAMTILGAAMKIMATAVQDFGNLSWEVIGRGLAGMAGALVGIGVAMRLMPGDMLIKAAAMVIMAQAIGMLVTPLQSLGNMSIEQIGKSLATLALTLIILAAAVNVMNGALAGAAAILIVAAALTLLVPVLQSLGSMDLMTIGIGLATLAAVFALLGVAALVLTPVIPALMGLGIAIMLLGAGAALAGLGMLAFAAGLTALAAAGAASGTVLIALVTALLGLIPYALTQIALGVVAMAQVIIDNIQVFVNLGIALITGFLDGMRVILPNVISFILDMLFMLVDAIANNIQRFVDAGVRIIVGFIQGIAGQIGNVVNAAVDLLVNFLNAIANNMPRVIDAGVNIIIAFIQGIASAALRITNAAAETIIKFVNGLATSIDNNAAALRSAGLNLARAIIDGMTGGLASSVGRVFAAAQDLASHIPDGIKKLLGINSPSKVTFGLGGWTGIGLANGILSTEDKIVTASDKIGTAAVDSMKDTLAGIWNRLEDDELDVNPTITPVLDLTTFRRDAKAMSSSLAAQNLSVDSSYGKAAILASTTRAVQDPTVDATGTPIGGTTITYNQTITSPKAVSAVEVYRGTKNQLSTVKKGELVKV